MTWSPLQMLKGFRSSNGGGKPISDPGPARFSDSEIASLKQRAEARIKRAQKQQEVRGARALHPRAAALRAAKVAD